MKAKALMLLMVVALMGAVMAAPMRAEAAAPTPTGITQTVPVTTTDPTGTVTNLLGTLNITSFANQGGVLTAIGTLTSSLLNNGNPIPVAIPVALPASSATCQILDLVLGPINLNLLGLVVTTNQIHLNITAVPGAGNLVGNLLCAVTNLLNNGGPLSGLTGLLNNILRHL